LNGNSLAIQASEMLGCARRSSWSAAAVEPGDGWIELLKAFAATRAEARQALKADLYALLDKFNAAEDGTLVVPSEYLQVIVTKRS
jgi:hypothetical protein